ncbi:G-protein alpha subunit-domain-containing protein [Suillus lakei]|nr:G-protein alpha subunit-domain-containing protein [Suillus lakei]
MDCLSQFYLMDSADYFFTEVLRIGTLDYTPTVNDVMRARAKTTSITETRFNMGQLSIHMFGVNGQRSERKKWIHCFESITSIIFCTALSEYDQVLLEEKNQNRMQQSLILFESIINSRWFLPNFHYIVFEQGRHFQEQATKGADREVLSRIYRRRRYQQSSQIYCIVVRAFLFNIS